MFEEFFELLISPLGLIAAAGLLVMPGGREMLRKATKSILRTGVQACDSIKEIYQEVQEEENEAVLETGGTRKTKQISAKG